MNDSPTQVSTGWLAANLDRPDVRIIDASWYLPQMERDAQAEYLAAHIPGAVPFNVDEIADASTGLPHMLADAETFGRAVSAFGISRDDTIIIYDGAGLFSAPRVWWNFRVMGAKKSFILAGGLPKWQAEGHPVTSTVPTPAPADFVAQPTAQSAVDRQVVLAASDGGDVQIVDLRPAARFAGEAAEPRSGLRSGHIPNSLNLPFSALVVDGQLAPKDVLRQEIADAGIDMDKPVITSCGSGVTAAFLNLALAELGVDAMQLYDGSWTEWGANKDLPLATGPAR
jgi:thiosulfate/3-mercaptopyruvate sulfurtransferase